jgi:lysophospholipid acyltransferase (LPLAT)-like uncharacterized protein
MPEAPEKRSLVRRVWHRLRPLLGRPLTALALVVVPRVYLLYMRGVFATSRVLPGEFPRLHDWIREHDGAVGLLWHEEVFTVAYGYHHLGFRPHTLASLGTAGEIITRMLGLCDFVVFRGGSSRKGSRRRTQVLEAMIEHMRSTREVIYGITVDGSQGPPYRLKRGGLVIARECQRPVILARTWYKRCLRLPTWDRTAIPLPWNEIRYYLAGPYAVPPDARDEPGLRRFQLRVEDDLIDLAVQSYRDLGQAVPANLVKRSAAERERFLREAESEEERA